MEGTIIVLPSQYEMLQNLNKVSDEGHIQKLWLKLSSNYGKRKYPLGVILMVELALNDYSNGMPNMMKNFLDGMVPDIIKAIVIDEQQCAECLAAWEDIQTKFKQQKTTA